ncbi:hypothetical protein SAMN05421748_14425 [Paractinoplanes atraurantiacus]|uniref:Prevent-host-death family protein n=2 Tax=Paractinoplanes atraurantiacus TaxID=1036182 RepID=A0A285KJP9_9ACTN|nr:hypothetical protein SAMN05421748_14425 [Actinoplanes atraurantiacus]
MSAVSPVFRELVDRYGPPVDVEDARARWSELVSAAFASEIVLITRERWEWAALVPVSEIAALSPALPVWSVSTARPSSDTWCARCSTAPSCSPGTGGRSPR